MNYLAHLFLAGTNPEIMVGNFIADHVKGSKKFEYSENVQYGIRMHRAIDSFTDSHILVHQSIVRLRPYFHKYSGVVVDMFYDHFLSANWNNYSAVDIHSFTKFRFDMLNSYKAILPERSARLLYFMEKQNWLLSYGGFEGMQMAFSGLARRTTFVSHMENAVDFLKKDYHSYNSEFSSYFPDLQKFVLDNFAEAYQ